MRGHTDLVINGSFWIGAGFGALGTLVLLDPAYIAPAYGWRAAFLIGAVLGLPIFFLRFFIPESPRWLAMHGREDEAEAVMETIEAHFPQGRQGSRRPEKAAAAAAVAYAVVRSVRDVVSRLSAAEFRGLESRRRAGLSL